MSALQCSQRDRLLRPRKEFPQDNSQKKTILKLKDTFSQILYRQRPRKASELSL